MALPTLVLYRRANAPAVRIVLEDVILTGSIIELDVTPKESGVTTTYSTGGSGLTLDGAHTVIWTYTEADALAIPLGGWTAFDLYRVVAEAREKIGAGTVKVNGVGGFEQQPPVFVEVPGIQGPAFAVPEGEWEPRLYPASSFVQHNGSSWWTEVETSGEPGVSPDWQRWLDGSGAEADRAAAENAAVTATGAAEVAVPAAATAVSAAETVVPLAAQVEADATAVETARAEVAANTTTVATNTASAEAAKDIAEAAALAAQQAVANPSVAYDLLTTLNADLVHAAGTVGQVLADGANNGFYVKVGSSGTGSWSKKSNATVPALDVRTGVLETTTNYQSASLYQLAQVLPIEQGADIVVSSRAWLGTVFTPATSFARWAVGVNPGSEVAYSGLTLYLQSVVATTTLTLDVIRRPLADGDLIDPGSTRPGDGPHDATVYTHIYTVAELGVTLTSAAAVAFPLPDLLASSAFIYFFVVTPRDASNAQTTMSVGKGAQDSVARPNWARGYYSNAGFVGFARPARVHRGH